MATREVMLTHVCRICWGRGCQEVNETVSALDMPLCPLCGGRGWLFTYAGVYVYMLHLWNNLGERV